MSTAMWRLRPSSRLPPSYQRVAVPTVSAARTVWESIAAAVGLGLRSAWKRNLFPQAVTNPFHHPGFRPASEETVHCLP
jgi:hypothetical protein